LSAPAAQARFLFSDPLLGPLASLLTVAPQAGEQPTCRASVAVALGLEREQQDQRQSCGPAVAARLIALGWQVEQEVWEETLSLPLGDGLLQRWFGAAADYRSRLSARLDGAGLQELESLFRLHRGLALPQPLRHTLIHARRRPEQAPAATASAEARSSARGPRRTATRAAAGTPAGTGPLHEKSPGEAGARET